MKKAHFWLTGTIKVANATSKVPAATKEQSTIADTLFPNLSMNIPPNMTTMMLGNE